MEHTKRVGDLTPDELRAIIREELQRMVQPGGESSQASAGDLSDFPVDHYRSWPPDLTLRREDMYGDDGR